MLSPSQALEAFRERLLRGECSSIGEVFSFSSAYEYWRDILISCGRPVMAADEFEETVRSLFASRLVVDHLRERGFRCIGERVLGPVASVVFDSGGLGEGSRTGVASLVRGNGGNGEDGGWKVRTCPGVFPGELFGGVLPRKGAAK